jgi:hypothetical protein
LGISIIRSKNTEYRGLSTRSLTQGQLGSVNAIAYTENSCGLHLSARQVFLLKRFLPYGSFPRRKTARLSRPLLMAKAEGGFADETAQQHYSKDALLVPVLRATSTTTTSSAVTPQMLVADLVDSLRGQSAAAEALGLGLQLPASGGSVFQNPASPSLRAQTSSASPESFRPSSLPPGPSTSKRIAGISMKNVQ